MPGIIPSLTQSQFAPRMGLVPAQQALSGSLDIKKSDFKIDVLQGKKYAKISDAVVKREKNPEALNEIDISDLHNNLKAIDQKQTEPGFKKNFKSFVTWIKDSKVGRFFTKNVIPTFTTTTVSGLSISAQAVDGSPGRTKLTIEASGEEKTFAVDGNNQPVEKDSKKIGDDNKIVTEYDKLRNRSLFQRLLGIQRRTPEETIERVNIDIERQTRLRNCGIGYRAETRFNQSNSGLVKTLNDPNALKLSDFTLEELQNLQEFNQKYPNGNLQIDNEKNEKLNQFKHLLQTKSDLNTKISDSKIRVGDQKTARKQLLAIEKQIQKADVNFLKPILVGAQIRQIKALVDAFGPESLTHNQHLALDKFSMALGFSEALGDRSKRFDGETFQNALLDFEQSQAIQELALMTSEALRSGHQMNAPSEAALKGHSAQNQKKLLDWEGQGVAPLGLLVSAPWFFSPEACDKQIQNLRNLSEGSAPDSLKSYLQEFKAEQKNQVSLISEEVEQDFHAQVQDAISGLEQLKDNRAGLYRWQGLMPLFANNNEDKITQAFSEQLENVFSTTTGLKSGGERRMFAAALATAGGIGALVSAAKGDTRSAALLAGGTFFVGLAATKKTSEIKYAQRLGMLSAGIVHGLVRGTVQQLDKANEALAQAKIEEKAETFVEAQTQQLAQSQLTIDNLQDFSILDQNLDSFSDNKRLVGANGSFLDKSHHLEGIRRDIGEKIHSARFEVDNAITQGVRLGFDPGMREKVSEASLRVKPLSPIDTQEVIYEGLNINPADVSLDPEIAQKLREFNDITLKNAQGLQQSLLIVQDAYAETGVAHQKIRLIENQLTSLFNNEDFQKLCGIPEQQIKSLVEGINDLRNSISNQAAKLTNDHATHLNTLIDSLDEKAGRLVEAKVAMNRIAQGFAVGDDAYLNGTGRESNNLQDDLEFLKGIITNSEQKQDLLLFGEEAIDKSIQGSFSQFISAANDAAQSWEKYQIHQAFITKSAIEGGDFQNAELINGLHIELKKCKADADHASANLDSFSQKYIGEKADYNKRTDKIYQNALLTGAGRLIGNVPVNGDTRHGLSILVSQFGTNKDVQKKISSYILQDQSAEGLKIPSEQIQQRFVELFQDLPPFDLTQVDNSEASLKWKSDLPNEKAVAFIQKIVPDFKEKSISLQGAIDIAKAFEGGVPEEGGIGSVSASVHRAHIQNQFEKVATSSAIKAIYQPLESMPKPDIRRVLHNHSGSLETLKAFGYNGERYDIAKSDLDLLNTYDRFTNKEPLNEAEYNLLSVVGEGLANLEEKPEVTKQLRLRAEVFALLAKANKGFAESSDFNELDDSKIAKFEFKPINQQNKFDNLNSQITKLQATLVQARAERHSARDEMKTALNSFVENCGGHPSVREKFETDPQMRDFAEQLIQISDAYNRGTGIPRETFNQEIELKKITQNIDALQLEKSYSDANSQKTIKDFKKQINRQTIPYVDISRLSLKSDLKKEDDFIQTDRSGALWSLISQIAAPQAPATGQFRQPVREVSTKAKALDTPDRIYKEELPNTIHRLMSEDNAGLQIEALRKALDGFHQLQDASRREKSCESFINSQTSERDKLLAASDKISYQQAVKAATVKGLLYDKSFSPETLNSQDHTTVVLEQLKHWGWSEDQLPITGEIEKAIQAIRDQKGIPKEWQDEMINNSVALKKQIQQIGALSQQINAAVNSIRDEFQAHPEIAQNLSDATEFSESNQLSLLQLRNLSDCLTKRQDVQPSKFAKAALESIVEKAKTQFSGQESGIQGWYDSLLQKLGDQNPAKWTEVSKIVAEHFTPRDGAKSLSDICYGSDDDNRVPQSQDLLSSIYMRAFESEAQKIIQSNCTKFSAEEKKTTTAFDNATKAFGSRSMGEIFKPDDKGNSLLYKNWAPRTWIKKYAEMTKKDSASVATDISEKNLDDFQRLLNSPKELGNLLQGSKGERLNQAKDFVNNLRETRKSIQDGLKMVQSGEQSWQAFSSEVNSRLEHLSTQSVNKSRTPKKDAMNSLAKAINTSPIVDTMLSEIQTLADVLSGSSYSPEKLGQLSTAYTRAKGDFQRYDNDLRSPYDPRPVDSEQHISEINVAEGNLHPDFLKYA